MLQAFVITLREGLEAFLIVAISLAYLRKSGQAALTQAVHWGIGAALAVSALGGYLLYNASNQEWLDGPLAIVAAVSVTWMIVHMWRAGRRMKGDIEGRLQSSVRTGARAFTGVFLFTLLMVSREGMETALLLMQLRETVHLALGAAAGVAGAAALAWLWAKYGHRVNLALFFQVTAIFLFVFVVQLGIKGVHEMSEQNLLPVQRGDPPGHRSVGTRQRVRPSADLSARRPAARVARHQVEVLHPVDRHAPGRAVAGAAAGRRSDRHRALIRRARADSRYNLGMAVKAPTVADFTWIGDLKFAATVNHASLTLDSASKAGPSPVDALAAALAGCMSIDLAHILQKGRHPLRGLTVAPGRRARAGGPAPLREDARCTSSVEGAVPRRRGRARDRALAREILLGLALDAAGHRLPGDV